MFIHNMSTFNFYSHKARTIIIGNIAVYNGKVIVFMRQHCIIFATLFDAEYHKKTFILKMFFKNVILYQIEISL